MIKSMTAYGRARHDGADRDFAVEIRSVNSRYADITVKLPRAYNFLEDKIKSFVQTKIISRGKIDVSLSVIEHTTPSVRILPDRGYLEGYLAALRQIRDEYGLADDISVMTVAKNPDVFRTERAEEDLSGDWERIEAVLAEAGAAFGAMREAEGARIERDLRGKIDGIRGIVASIASESADDIASYREKLEARLRTVLAEHGVQADEGRILTECALMADKLAVDEELVRLESHFVAFFDIIASNKPVGRELDFLMQEMNREINTTGSKCCNAAIAREVVAVKNELEKIREQIQNIE